MTIAQKQENVKIFVNVLSCSTKCSMKCSGKFSLGSGLCKVFSIFMKAKVMLNLQMIFDENWFLDNELEI